MGSRPHRMLISDNAAGSLPSWLKVKGCSRLLLLCDENTHRAWGAAVHDLLAAEGVKVHLRRLEGSPVLADERRVVEALLSLTPEVDVVCSVGGGTLTDIGRFVAHRGNRPFVALPTAPSVDGFYSIGSPLILRGVKRTILCRPPEALFADTGVLSRAPRKLTASGFGDLLGKLTSWADWNLGALLWDEPFDQTVSQELFAIARESLELAASISAPTASDYAALMELLIRSGACMVDAGESRPASGAEHHLSHYWEMSFLSGGQEPPLHGAKVGYATQLVAALYRHLLSLDAEAVRTVIRSARTRKREDEAPVISEGYPPEISEQLVRDQEPFLTLSDADYSTLLSRIEASWERIAAIAREVPAPQGVTGYLKGARAPTTAAELEIDPDAVPRALRYAHYLRNRFTVLKLYRVLGIDPEPVARAAVGGSFYS